MDNGHDRKLLLNLENHALPDQYIWDGHNQYSVHLVVQKFGGLLLCLNQDISGKTVGIPNEYSIKGTPEEISQIWEDAIMEC